MIDDLQSELNQLIAAQEQRELNELCTVVGVQVAGESLADAFNRVAAESTLCAKTLSALAEALNRCPQPSAE